MSRRRRGQDDLCSQFQHLSFYDQPSTSRGHRGHGKMTATPPKPSIKNPNIFHMSHNGNKSVWYRNLHPSEQMYQKIESLITSEDFIIENIVEVNNAFLQKAYDLKKEQKRKIFGEVYESLVFHGTRKANVGSICTYNFDWRLFGTSTGHKYGKGVSFSTCPKYASFYSDQDYHKVMIVAKVLIANVCQGHSNMAYPPPGYDTSQKGDDGAVIVKYEDHEFYPAYKLYYHLEEQESEEDEYDDGTNYNYYVGEDDDSDEYYINYNKYNIYFNY